MRVHKRLVDMAMDERALRLVMRVPLPEGLPIVLGFASRAFAFTHGIGMKKVRFRACILMMQEMRIRI